MDITQLKNTQATYFLIPLLFAEDIKHYHILKEEFRNAYIADLDNKQYDDKILLVYSEYPVGIPAGKRLEEYKHNGNVVFVYDIPEEFKDDYGHFLTGEWSSLSDNAKQKILSFWEEKEDSLIYGILYKEANRLIKSFYKKYTELDPIKDIIDDYWYKPNLILEVLGS